MFKKKGFCSREIPNRGIHLPASSQAMGLYTTIRRWLKSFRIFSECNVVFVFFSDGWIAHLVLCVYGTRTHLQRKYRHLTSDRSSNERVRE